MEFRAPLLVFPVRQAGRRSYGTRWGGALGAGGLGGAGAVAKGSARGRCPVVPCGGEERKRVPEGLVPDPPRPRCRVSSRPVPGHVRGPAGARCAACAPPSRWPWRRRSRPTTRRCAGGRQRFDPLWSVPPPVPGGAGRRGLNRATRPGTAVPHLTVRVPRPRSGPCADRPAHAARGRAVRPAGPVAVSSPGGTDRGARVLGRRAAHGGRLLHRRSTGQGRSTGQADDTGSTSGDRAAARAVDAVIRRRWWRRHRTS